jgi:hypothetical protein
LQLVAFGAKDGVFEIPDELETKKYATYLGNVVTTLSTLGITCAPNTSLRRTRNSTIRALYIMRKYAFNFAESVWGSFSKVENQVPRVLHLHKRVIAKVLTLLFTRSLDELASEEKTKWIKHIEMFHSFLTCSLWATSRHLVTGNVQSRMAMRLEIAALRTGKQK